MFGVRQDRVTICALNRSVCGQIRIFFVFTAICVNSAALSVFPLFFYFVLEFF